MKKITIIMLSAFLLLIYGCGSRVSQPAPQPGPQPQTQAQPTEVVYPQVITPGKDCGEPPSNAIVLFDGKDASAFQRGVGDGGPIKWNIGRGFMEVVPGTGGIITKQGFGDCHLHVEWAAPENVVSEGQGRGNSGVYLMSRYEVQILDSFNNDTYPDGQAGAIYEQYPPLFNACREPGKWQSYDIVFKRPRFDETGNLLQPAYMTVMHNGVAIQNNVLLGGWPQWETQEQKNLIVKYLPHPDRIPVYFQDHGNPVRFRNIWIVDLEGELK
jgi:hypothetical protein